MLKSHIAHRRIHSESFLSESLSYTAQSCICPRLYYAQVFEFQRTSLLGRAHRNTFQSGNELNSTGHFDNAHMEVA
jgi:hypothetical protein